MIDRVLADSMENSVIGDKPTPGVHPLHSHLLLYTQVSDSRQVLYTLECVKNVLKSNARLAICALSTTNLNSKPSPRSHQVYYQGMRQHGCTRRSQFLTHALSDIRFFIRFCLLSFFLTRFNLVWIGQVDLISVGFDDFSLIRVLLHKPISVSVSLRIAFLRMLINRLTISQILQNIYFTFFFKN